MLLLQRGGVERCVQQPWVVDGRVSVAKNEATAVTSLLRFRPRAGGPEYSKFKRIFSSSTPLQFFYVESESCGTEDAQTVCQDGEWGSSVDRRCIEPIFCQRESVVCSSGLPIVACRKSPASSYTA